MPNPTGGFEGGGGSTIAIGTIMAITARVTASRAEQQERRKGGGGCSRSTLSCFSLGQILPPFSEL